MANTTETFFGSSFGKAETDQIVAGVWATFKIALTVETQMVDQAGKQIPFYTLKHFGRMGLQRYEVIAGFIKGIKYGNRN